MKIKTECSVCPTKIWYFNGAKLKKTNEYHEVDVIMNDGSSMTTGVCSKHTNPKKLEITMMTEKLHQGWLEEVAFGIGNEEWVRDKGMSLAVTGKRG